MTLAASREMTRKISPFDTRLLNISILAKKPEKGGIPPWASQLADIAKAAGKEAIMQAQVDN